MTKDELLRKIPTFHISDGIGYFRIYDVVTFMSQNVCIPKGENRHPSSDVLHQAIEGTKIQGWNHTHGIWEDDTSWFIDKNDLDYPTKYRIKPSEPIYEWQYLLTAPNCGCTYTKHMADEEAEQYDMGYYKHMVKVEDTKRIKK